MTPLVPMPHGSRRASLIGILAAAGATWLACWPALGLGFTSDDFLILARLGTDGGLPFAVRVWTWSHFDYYRPVAFLSFGLEHSLWGTNPAGYHVTNLLLHLVNVVFVFGLARRLAGPAGATAAALWFGLHGAHHEAVYWVSARFDLLATAFVLAGLLVLLRGPRRGRDAWVAAALLAALLAKESAAALPIVAAAAVVLLDGAGMKRVWRLLAWLAGSVLVYVALRSQAGLDTAGGAARLPKLAALTLLALLPIVAARWPWEAITRAVWRRRHPALAIGGLIALAAALALMSDAATARPVREALTSIGFSVLHLATPVSPTTLVSSLPPGVAWFGLAAAVVMLAGSLTGGSPWWARREAAFLVVFLAGALVPVSSMTEGTRYLYLASVPVALAAGLVAAWAVSARVWIPLVLGGVLTVMGGTQLRVKAADWRWAADMAADAARTMRDAGGTACQDGEILLATAPARQRGVYANLNLPGLDALAGCRPARLWTLVRTDLADVGGVTAAQTPDTVSIEAAGYQGGFTVSRDLTRFTIALPPDRPLSFDTPAGRFTSAPGASGLRIRLARGAGTRADCPPVFLFARDRVTPVPCQGPDSGALPETPGGPQEPAGVK